MKSVEKEVFSQDHTVNPTCVMFFYAAMRRKTVSKNFIICKTTFVIKILSIDIVVSVFLDTVYGDIIVKCKHNFSILLAVSRPV